MHQSINYLSVQVPWDVGQVISYFSKTICKTNKDSYSFKLIWGSNFINWRLQENIYCLRILVYLSFFAFDLKSLCISIWTKSSFLAFCWALINCCLVGNFFSFLSFALFCFVLLLVFCCCFCGFFVCLLLFFMTRLWTINS